MGRPVAKRKQVAGDAGGTRSGTVGRAPCGWDWARREGGGVGRRWLRGSADTAICQDLGLAEGRKFFSSQHGAQRPARTQEVGSKKRLACAPRSPGEASGSEEGRCSGPGRTGAPSRPGAGGAGLGARVSGQMQAQQRVEQSSLAGGPALPAFLLTLGSSRVKDMARAQW